MLAKLFAAFPDQRRDSRMTAAVYAEALADVADADLERGIATVIRMSKWFPSVREIRDAAHRREHEPTIAPEHRIDPPARDDGRPSPEAKARVAELLAHWRTRRAGGAA